MMNTPWQNDNISNIKYVKDTKQLAWLENLPPLLKELALPDDCCGCAGWSANQINKLLNEIKETQ